MANNIKGITVEIGGDTTGLDKALSSVNKTIKNTQSELKEVTKLLKLDPSNTELLTQKQKLLGDTVHATSEKLETLKTAQEQAKKQLENGDLGQDKYDALQREIIKTEQELKELREQAIESNTALVKLSEVGGQLKTAGDQIEGAGKKLLPVTAGITALGTAAVKTASDFESSMSQVQATMGITKDAMSEVDGQTVNTMDTLSALAKKMGSETAFSASECAEALNYLALAGYDTQQMCDTLPIVLNLAAAGGIDLASASDMVTDAMSALGMETSQADTMVDQMAKTASSTNTSVAQLGEGILKIGATAKAIKGGTAELNTALGILANNGIKGAEGGTHLRNVILSLQSPTDKAAAMMENLGIKVYDSEGNMRSLNDILGDLNVNLDGMTSAEKDNIISTIFNKTDLAAVNALLSNTGDSWDSLQQSIIDSGGAAQQMADTQLDNLGGQLTILKSALEGLAISFGQILLPVIKSITKKVQAFVDKLNAMDDGQKQTIVRIAAVVAAIGPLLVIIGKVTSTVGSVMQGVSSLGTILGKLGVTAASTGGGVASLGASIAAVAGPVLAVVAVIATLVAAFKYLWDTNEEFRAAITSIWDGIKAKFEAFSQGIVDRLNALGFDFESIVDVLKSIWDGFCNLLAPIFEGAFARISNILSVTMDVITGLLDLFIGLFTGNWSQMWDGVKEIFSGVWDFICRYFSIMTNTLRGIADTVLGWLGTSWSEVWGSIRDFFVGIWEGITGFFSGAVQTIQNTASSVFSWFSTTWNTVWNSVKTTFEGIWNGITGFLTSAWEIIKNVVSVGVQFIGALLQAAFDIITLPFRFIWENCKETILAAWESIKNTVSTAVNAVSQTVSSVMNAIQTTISNIWTAISTKVSSVVTAIQTTVTNVFTSIKSTVTSVWNSISSAVGTAVDAVKNKVTTVFTAVKTTASDIWNGVKTSISTTVDGIKTKVSSVFESIKSSVSTVFSSIKSTASSLWNSIKETITKPIDAAKTAVKSALDKISGFFSGLKLSFPSIKLPHFSIKGEFSLTPPSVPHLSIDWYKEGGIMDGATIFGMNGSSLMAGGEAGKEAILPLKGFYDQLESMMSGYLNTDRMEKYLAIIADNSSKGIYLEDGTLVGHLLPAIDGKLGESQKLQRRLSL